MKGTIFADPRYFRGKDFPYFHNQGLATGQLALHEVHVQVKVFVVQLFYYFPTDQRAQLLKVDNKTGIGVWLAFYRNNQIEVVAMPVFVGAWPKNLNVLPFRPGRVIQLVCRIEMLFSTYVDHTFILAQIYVNLPQNILLVMIIVTGAAGFIGSCLIKKLNSGNFNALVAVDKFDNGEKNKNLEGARLKEKVDRDEFMTWLDKHHENVEFIFHIGARTDTAEFDMGLLHKLNTEYSKAIWERCARYQVPLVYASSAATYGLGEQGYNDDESTIGALKPLNPYGLSKQEFDAWALSQNNKPFYWAGLKFFNVYGPNEYHKGRMASVILHAFRQINATGKMKLFKSHNPKYKDGGQMRDFVYVKDVVDVCCHLMHHRKGSGIYNLGSGKARTFLDLTRNVFNAMGKKEDIEFIDTPVDIRDKYQYFTEANMEKLKSIGYGKPFSTLEEGVAK